MDPFVYAYKAQRHNIIQVLYLVLDESMSGWRPTNTKTGSISNLNQGSQSILVLWFGMELSITTGIFVHHNIVCGPREQAMEKYINQELSLPRKEQIMMHVA